MNKFTLLAVCSFLSACGGGEGSGSSDSSAAEVQQPTVTEVVANTQATDLQTDTQFNFYTVNQVTVQLKRQNSNETFFVNVCGLKGGDDFDALQTRDECLVRTKLEDGDLDFSLTLSPETKQLVAEVINFDDLTAPSLYRWNVTDSGTWSLELP